MAGQGAASEMGICKGKSQQSLQKEDGKKRGKGEGEGKGKGKERKGEREKERTE